MSMPSKPLTISAWLHTATFRLMFRSDFIFLLVYLLTSPWWSTSLASFCITLDLSASTHSFWNYRFLTPFGPFSFVIIVVVSGIMAILFIPNHKQHTCIIQIANKKTLEEKFWLLFLLFLALVVTYFLHLTADNLYRIFLKWPEDIKRLLKRKSDIG